MPWWLRRIIDFLNWLPRTRARRTVSAARYDVAARISGHKYDVLARRAGRAAEDPPPSQQRRFVALQIDGLAYDTLIQAMAMGYLPTLRRLLARGCRLQRWRCGLPSTTPAVQAGIMYGNNWDIPAFRWYEKEEGSTLVCRIPSHAQRIKARVAAGHPGILAGGSSYTNIWDGDARLAFLTLSAMGRQRVFENLRGMGWLLLFALIPWRVLRIVGLAIWEVLRDWKSALALWIRSGFRHRPMLVRPVLETLTNVVVGEVQTFGVLLDVYRGMPAIYANFYGYDEVAHGDGSLGREALRALKRIDSRIREIDRVRRMYWPDMDLYIFSDHGMTPAIAFQAMSGQSLGQFVADHVRASVDWDQVGAAPRGRQAGEAPPMAVRGGEAPPMAVRGGAAYLSGPRSDFKPHGRLWLLDELDGIEPHLSQRGKRLVQVLRRWMLERVRPDPDSEWDLARGSDVVVRSSGSLAHIYFNVTREHMDISEVAILYPALLDGLADHPGIGLVLGTQDGHPVVVTRHGTAALSKEWLPPGLPEPEQSAADLARLALFPHSGDLVLLGAWDIQGRVIAFEDQAATHGGIGGPQDYPFFITPPGNPLDLARVTNAEQLYPYFMSRYQDTDEM